MIKRRQHSAEFKQQVVAESNRRGASVAGVALAHGVNANKLHKWRRALLRGQASATRSKLLAVTVEPTQIMIDPPTIEPCPGAIEIELPNARLTVRGRVDHDACRPSSPCCIGDDQSAGRNKGLARRRRHRHAARHGRARRTGLKRARRDPFLRPRLPLPGQTR